MVRKGICCFVSLWVSLNCAPAWAQYYPQGDQYFPIKTEKLATMASDHSLEIYLGQIREQFIVYNRSDGVAFIYKSKASEGGYRSGVWQQGYWRTTDSLYCLQADNEACGTIYVEKRGSRPSQAWWQFDSKNKTQLQELHVGDPFGLSDPVEFYGMKAKHPLAKKTVMFRAEKQPNTDLSVVLGKPIVIAEVIGYRPRQAGTIPAGFLVRIIGSLTSSLRTYDTTERELRFEKSSGCAGIYCANEVHFIKEGRFLRPSHFTKLLQAMEPDKPLPVVWRTARDQLGWAEVQGRIVVDKDAIETAIVYNNANTSQVELDIAQQAVTDEQSSSGAVLFRQHMVGRTVRLSGMIMPELQVFLDPNGAGYVYRENITTQHDPRRGNWAKSTWQIANGQLCFPALDADCFNIIKAGADVFQLSLDDGRKSWKPTLVASEASDVLGLRNPIQFYDWETYHRRIGETLLFQEGGTRLINGGAITEGEIIGYRDILGNPNQSGFYVKPATARRVQVYVTPEEDLVLGFPQARMCSQEPCPDEIRFVTLPQEITQPALDELLANSERIQAGGKKWRALRFGVSAALLGGLAYGVLSPNDVAGSSHSTTDDLTDMFMDRLKRYEEALKEKVDRAEADLREAQRQYEQQQKDSENQTEQTAEQSSGTAKENTDYLRLEFNGADFFSDDPYSVLGVKPNARKAEIKAAWRELVKQWHPDVQVGGAAKIEAEEIIKRVNWAYDQVK